MRTAIWPVTLGLLCGLCLGATCSRPPTPPSPATGGTQATGGAAPTGGEGGALPAVDACEAAELRLAELECRSGGAPLWVTPAGTPFATVCRNREVDGDSVCPDCLARIRSCDDVPACKATSPGVCP